MSASASMEGVLYVGTIYAGADTAAYVYVTKERNGHAIFLKTYTRRLQDEDASSYEVSLLEYVSVHDAAVTARSDTRDTAIESAVNYVNRERALRLKRAVGGAS